MERMLRKHASRCFDRQLSSFSPPVMRCASHWRAEFVRSAAAIVFPRRGNVPRFGAKRQKRVPAKPGDGVEGNQKTRSQNDLYGTAVSLLLTSPFRGKSTREARRMGASQP